MGVRRRGEKEGGRRRQNTANKLDRSTRAQVGPIEGQYSGHARELVNRFIARLVDRSIGRREKREEGEKGPADWGRDSTRLDSGRGVSERHRNFLNAA